MSMTRKDFLIIANSLKINKPREISNNRSDLFLAQNYREQVDLFDSIVYRISFNLEKNYTNFNREKFVDYINK